MSRLFARLVFVPTLAWNLFSAKFRKNWKWWTRIDDHLLLGAFPFASTVPELAAQGVRAVVNTCDEYAGPIKAYQQAHIEQLRIPTVDFTPPTLEMVEQAVAFIKRRIAQGHTVYVHCKAGRGRSATVVACWLIETKGLTPEQAQDLLIAKRRQVLRKIAQRDVVQQFYARRKNDRTSS